MYTTGFQEDGPSRRRSIYSTHRNENVEAVGERGGQRSVVV